MKLQSDINNKIKDGLDEVMKVQCCQIQVPKLVLKRIRANYYPLFNNNHIRICFLYFIHNVWYGEITVTPLQQRMSFGE